MKFTIDSGKGSHLILYELLQKWEQCSRLVVEEEETNSLKITICFCFGLAIDVMLLLFVPSLMCNITS